MRIRGFIFDLDGTLVNTLPIVFTAFHKTLLEFSGYCYSDDELCSLFGPSEEGIFKKLFPDSWEVPLNYYLQEYEKLHSVYGEPFPGIKEALSLLKNRGLKLAIVSSKGPSTMDISLRHSGLKPFFEVIETGSEEGASKPDHIKKVLDIWNCSPAEVVYVGDIAYDVEAAKEAGVVPVSAVWADSAQAEKVLKMEPAAAFKDVQEFIEWIKLKI